MGSGLTPLMQRFAEERARRGSARGSGIESARAAGYQGSDNTLRVRASQLLRDPRVRAEVARLRLAARSSLAAAPATELVEDPGAPAVIMGLGRKLRILASIAESTEQKASDRIRAIELASKLDGDLGNARGPQGDLDAVQAAAAAASGPARMVVAWVGNARGPAPGDGKAVTDGT